MATRVYSRRQLRSRFWRWCGQRRRFVVTAFAVLAGLLAIETAFLLWFDPAGDLRWYLMGVAHAVFVGLAPSFLFLAFLVADPEAMKHLRGAWGEENTQGELKTAKRRRLVWGWADSVTLAYGDIDHLVVTRSAGVLAIDSKWRNTFDVHDRDAMARAADKVKLRATGVVDTVLRAGPRGQRASGHAVRIRPVVVVWGALQSEIPDSAQAHGVDFVAGSRLVDWLRTFGGDPIDKNAAKELLRRVEAFRDTQASAAKAAARA